MNPLVRKTTEKILGHEIRHEDMSIAVIIGHAIIEALEAANYNPKYNLKGGNDIDENTIGNFDVSISVPENLFDVIKEPIGLFTKVDISKAFINNVIPTGDTFRNCFKNHK